MNYIEQWGTAKKSDGHTMFSPPRMMMSLTSNKIQHNGGSLKRSRTSVTNVEEAFFIQIPEVSRLEPTIPRKDLVSRG
jgi:hypothetical protein